MVLNDKILERKQNAILHILDQDGGCSLIEALGVLEFVKMTAIDNFNIMRSQAKKPVKDYNALKARRLTDMTH